MSPSPKYHACWMGVFLILSTLAAKDFTVEDFSSLKPWRSQSANVEAPFKANDGVLSVEMPFHNDKRDQFGLARGLDVDLAGWKALHLKVRIPKKSTLTFEWTIDKKFTRVLGYRPGTGEWDTVVLPITGEKLTGFVFGFGESGVTNTGDETRTTEIGRIWLEDAAPKAAPPPAMVGSQQTGIAPKPTPVVNPIPVPNLLSGERAAFRFFVSTTGSDQADGLSAAPQGKSGPFKTLARARDAIRAIPSRSSLKEPVVVEIAAGVYELTEALALKDSDSGSEASPVIWRAKKGETVRIIGGQVVRGFAPVTGDGLKRLSAEARGKVLVADLKAQGITRYGEIKNGPAWANSDTGMELFFADKPMTLARYPNEGYMRIAETLVDDGHNIHGQKGSKVGAFTVKDDRVKQWIGQPQVMAHGFWFWDWADQRYMVERIDGEQNAIFLSNANHNYGFRKNQWFYAYNLLPELDAPGEWYADREKGLLYFWPPSPIEKGIAMVSVASNLITLENAKHVEFRYLTFECVQDTAITGKGLDSVRFVGCTLRNIGAYGIIAEGKNLSALGCDVVDVGDGGIRFTGGDRKTLTPGMNLVENCHIHRWSRWDLLYKGGIELYGVGNTARRNLIHDAPHTAIFWGGNEITMEGNEIHSVVYESGDAGAIYSGRNWTCRGTRVLNNYFHHIYGFEGRGANGVYFDDQYSSAEMVGNILWKVPKGLLAGGGRDHLIAQNIFFECDKAIHFDARGLGWSAGGKDDLIAKLKAMPYDQEPWKSRYPKLQGILDDEPMAPKGNWVDRNITWRCEGNAIDGKAAPYMNWGTNLVEVDPLFENAPGGDFRLKPSSPALAMGFAAISMEKIGLYADASRATWPVDNQVREGKSALNQANPHPAAAVKVPSGSRSPVADGTLDDAAWNNAAILPIAEGLNRESIANPAEARVLRVGEHLMVAVTIPVKVPSKILKEAQWGRSDGVEVCFRLHEGIDYRPGPTFVVQGFPGSDKSGAVYGRAAENAGTQMALASKVAARITDKGWTVTFDIPLGMAGIAVAPGTKLGFNIGVRRTEGNSWLTFGGTQGANHHLANGRVIVLE